MSRFGRGFFIVWVVLRYGLDELVLTSFQKPWLRLLARIVSVGRSLDEPRGQRLREALGPANSSVLCEQLTAVLQILARGDAPDAVAEHLAGAMLFAIEKKDGGIRPIATREILQRLTAKCNVFSAREAARSYL